MGLKVAMIKMQGLATKEENIAKATKYIGVAVANGAQIVCLQELFNTIYFCYEANPEYLDLAEPIPGPTINAMAEVAAKHRIVLIAPIYERRWPASCTTPRRCWGQTAPFSASTARAVSPLSRRQPSVVSEVLLQARQHWLRGVPDAVRDQGWHPDLPRSQLSRGCPRSRASGRGHRPHAIRDRRRPSTGGK